MESHDPQKIKTILSTLTALSEDKSLEYDFDNVEQELSHRGFNDIDHLRRIIEHFVDELTA